MSYSLVILSTAYLPPIQYFAKLVGYQNVYTEVFETYSKQSFRNRCEILSCNGPLSLIVPVIKTNGNKTLTKDIRIDYSTNWQKNHWKAIESAYRNSAYYDFVSDLLLPFYSQKETFLIDFNSKINNELLLFLGISKKINETDQFLKQYAADIADLRAAIHPKTQFQTDDAHFSPVKYYQVFSDRYEFVPNLSIIDLLFNEGLNSVSVIENSIKK